jgi:DNA repair protein RadD
MEYKPRFYQDLAFKRTISFLKEESGKHGLIVLPTGSGKSYVIAQLISYLLEKYSIKILVVSHTKEILQQDLNKLNELLPQQDIKIYSASFKKKEIGQLTIASIQSIRNKGHLFADVKLIIVDEAHLISPSAEHSYRRLFDAIPSARILGYTATPFRYKVI